jgi:hypothetical protein
MCQQFKRYTQNRISIAAKIGTPKNVEEME